MNTFRELFGRLYLKLENGSIYMASEITSTYVYADFFNGMAMSTLPDKVVCVLMNSVNVCVEFLSSLSYSLLKQPAIWHNKIVVTCD